MAWQPANVVEGPRADLEVAVLRIVSALDTGSIQGRGHGILVADRGVEVTFLLAQSDFQALRQQMLTSGAGEVTFTVSLRDVTAIDVASEKAFGPGRAQRAGD
jgi:hypothetical protein